MAVEMTLRYKYDMMPCYSARGKGRMESIEERPDPGLERPDKPMSPRYERSKQVSRPHALNKTKSTDHSSARTFDPSLNASFCLRCRRLFQSSEGPGLPIVEKETGAFYNFWDCYYLSKSAQLGCKICILVDRSLERFRHLLANYEAVPGKYDFGDFLGNSGTHAVRFYFYNFLIIKGKMVPRQMPIITITLEPRMGMATGSAESKQDDTKFPLEARRTSTGDAEPLAKVSGWITHCDENHSCRGKVNTTADQFLPTRLIHVGSDDASDPPRLVNGNDLTPGSRYLTLSHCWGRPGPTVILKDEHLESFKTTLPFKRLPATFYQAIHVTRALGVAYLWIDSLCIIQEQETKEDWLVEAPTMWKVYRNSYLNLSATSSSHSEDGLFRERPAQAVEQVVATVDEHSQFASGEYAVYDDMEWFIQVDHGAVNSRAWVYQERSLVPRIVHFSEHQLFWECQELKASEMFPDGIPDRYDVGPDNLIHKKLPSSDPRDLLEVWDSIVRTYTATELSFTSDKLIAVSALARQIADISDIAGEYLAGMWKDHLIGQLLWSSTRYSSRAAEYRAPSWSWASIDGAVRPNFDWSGYNEERYTSRPLIKVLNVSVIPQSDIYSSASNGSLTVSGPLLKVKELITPEEEKEQSIESNTDSTQTPEQKRALFTKMMKQVNPDYTGEDAQSFDVSEGNNSEAVKLTFDVKHGVAAIDESGRKNIQQLGPRSKRHFAVKFSQHTADLWLDEDLHEGDKLKEELYLLPVSCWGEYDYKMDREGREIESLDGLVLTPAEDGGFRRMGVFYLNEYSAADFLCELGNQERALIPVEQSSWQEMAVEDFVPERWTAKKLEFMPNFIYCCRVKIV